MVPSSSPSPGGSSFTSSSTTPTMITSRKGGVPHTLSEWFSSPPNTDPSLPSPDRISHRQLRISDWTITSSRGAIGNSAYMEGLGEKLGIPPPEMVFPSNRLVLRHETTGWEYVFGVEKALRCVDGVNRNWRVQGVDLSQEWRGQASGGASGTGKKSTTQFGEKPDRKKKSKGIKVAYADEWGKSREPTSQSTTSTAAAASPTSTPPTTAFGAAAATQIADARDYDWTYSTTWAGEARRSASSSSTSSPPSSETPTFTPGKDPAIDRIPVERLGASSGEPILFYDDLVLFEDELGDNGSSMLGVKVRVMPTGFLVLQRFLLRVDDVVFRLFDTRMYCVFDEQSQEATLSSSSASPALPQPGARPGSTVAPPAMAPWASGGTTRPPPPTSAAPGLPSLGGLSLGQPRRTGGGAPQLGHPAASTPASSGAGHASSSASVEQRLIRECSGCEAPYKDVKARLPAYRPNDLSLLTDSNWVSTTLQNLAAKQFAAFQSSNTPSKSSQSNGKTTTTTTTSGLPAFSASSSSVASRPAQPPTQAPPNALLSQTLAPARLPGHPTGNEASGAPQNVAPPSGIVGEVDGVAAEEMWEGVGGRVDVVTFGGA